MKTLHLSSCMILVLAMGVSHCKQSKMRVSGARDSQGAEDQSANGNGNTNQDPNQNNAGNGTIGGEGSSTFPSQGQDANGKPVTPPVMIFTADDKESPVTTTLGNTLKITWKVTDADQCSVLPTGWTGLSGTQNYKVTGDTELLLSCTKGSQIYSKPLKIASTTPSAPQLSISVSTGTPQNSVTVNPGTTVTISWSAQNVDQCSVQPINATGISGSQSLAVQASTVFLLSCTSSAGTSLAYAIVNVDSNPSNQPSIEMKINNATPPLNLSYGSTALVTWTSTGMKSCQLSPSNTSGVNGQYQSPALTAPALYILSCTTDSNATMYAAALAQVAPAEQPLITLTIGGVSGPATLSRNTPSTLVWSSSRAQSCTVSSVYKSQLAVGLSGSYTIAAPQVSDIYFVSCSGPGGNNMVFSPVFIPIQAPSVDFTANGSKGSVIVNAGSDVNLVWNAKNLDSCKLLPDGTLGLTGQKTVTSLTASTSYTLECTGPLGTSSYGVSVVVQALPEIGVTLTANGSTQPAPLTYGAPLRMAWTSVNASTCVLSPSGTNALNGEFQVAAVTATTSYTLSCTAPNRAPVSRRVDVNVLPPTPPSIDFFANGQTGTVQLESSPDIVLTWRTRLAQSCTLAGNPLNNFTEGSLSITNITADKTYDFVCVGPGGTSSRSIIVRAPIACETRAAIIPGRSQEVRNFTQGREEVRDFMNSTNKFTFIPITSIYGVSLIYAGMVSADALTASVVCKVAGYFEPTAIGANRWTSPFDNSIAYFADDAQIKKNFKFINGANTDIINTMTCKGRLLDRCVTDTRWLLGR